MTQHTPTPFLTPYQLDWLRANCQAFAYVERTTGDVLRESRQKIAEQKKGN